MLTKNENISYLKSCKICGNNKLKKVIKLNEQYISTTFVKSNRENNLKKIKSTLNLLLCIQNGNLNNAHNEFFQKNSNSYYNSINLDTEVFNNENYISASQLLAGNSIPKTQIPTIVVPPMADMDNFKPNDLVRHSQVNKHTNYDLGRSGYIQDDDCNQKFKQLQNKQNLNLGINDIINSRSMVNANQQIEGESKNMKF